MNEVSCRAIECFIPALEARGIPPARLVEGLPIALEHVMDPSRRIDWETSVQLLERAEELLGPGGLDEIGEHSLDSAPLRLFRLLGLFVADSRHLYRLGCRWASFFLTNVSFHYSDLGQGLLRIDLELPEHYRGCPQFFQAARGGLRVLPRLMERGEARIEAEIAPHRARYTVRPPRRIGLPGRLRRLLKLPKAARRAIEEMERQQHELNRALDDVRQTQAQLSAEVERVAALDHLGQTLLRQLSPHELPDRILEFLIQRFGWNGASLWLRSPEDTERVAFFGRAGDTEGEASRRFQVRVGDHSLGHLEAWHPGRGDTTADESALERLLPWIAMTVLNARAASTPPPEDVGAGLRWASASGRDLFLVLDAQTRILYAGPRPGDLLGYEQEELISQVALELIHPEDRPRLQRDLSSLAQHSSSAIYANARMRQSDGSFRHLEGVVIKVLSEAGDDVYMLSCGEVGSRATAN